MLRIAALALIALIPTPLAAQTLVGTAQVVDGDSLLVGGKMVRLFGIDAPEGDQTCKRGGETWRCGDASAEQLRALIGGASVTCHPRDIDKHDRVVAVCHAAGYELNRTMARAGWATAYRSFSDAYVVDETRAKIERIGIWDSQFELPEYHRMAKRPATQSQPRRASYAAPAAAPRAARVRLANTRDGRCNIKGNRSYRGEWIYHLPGMPYYARTRPEEIFCTEAAAQAAGYRRAIVRR